MGESVSDAQFIIEIAWDRPDLPGVVGPFDDRAEAEEWGGLNIPNGAWMVVPITYPYMRSTPEPTCGVDVDPPGQDVPR